jgi:soluble lytic murein transglycosylase-like protein
MDREVIYSQFILLLPFFALASAQTVPAVRTKPSVEAVAPPAQKAEPAKAEPAKPAPPKPEAAKPTPAKVESSVERQRNSIARQVESLKKVNPEAFPITKLPAEEPPVPPPPPSQIDPPNQISCRPLPRGGLEPVITLAASRAGISPQLVRAVISQESSFNPCAVSSKGALGLMQLMPGTARQLGVSNPFDPSQNINAGAYFLRQLIDRYGGDLVLALSAYNAGPGTVDRAGKMPAIPETANYVRRIMGSLGFE